PGLWRSSSTIAADRKLAGEEMGRTVSGVRPCRHSAGHGRRKTLAVFFGLRALEKDAGGISAAVRAYLQHPCGFVSLLQRVWHTPGIVESVHGSGRNFRVAADEWKFPGDL